MSSWRDYRAISRTRLNEGLFQAIFIDDANSLGPVTTRAKLYLYANTGSLQDSLDTCLLFDDPALSLSTLPAETRILLAVDPAGVVEPGNPITYVLAYTNSDPAIDHHVEISDVLSSEVTSPIMISSGLLITPLIGSRLAWQVDDLASGQAASSRSLPLSLWMPPSRSQTPP